MQFSEDSEERELEGLMQRSVAYLLEQVHSSDEAFQLCASYSEVYNEQVKDVFSQYTKSKHIHAVLLTNSLL